MGPGADRAIRRISTALLVLAPAGIFVVWLQCPGEVRPAFRVHTNEEYLAELTLRTDLDVTSPVQVLSAVLASLPGRVSVYPTGNYYYFSFMHHGTPYVGNLRLDPLFREQGRVPLAYYPDAPGGVDDGTDRAAGLTAVLDASHGVFVEMVERLAVRVTLGRKTVVFALNDLSRVKAPPAALARHDRFVGPIFDESGVRFLLVYNTAIRAFHYILDETAPVPEQFRSSSLTDRIVIGRRTGFAFYRDRERSRLILIGVMETNRRANNYFDGPFDQLPDNFIEGESLRHLILEIDPGLEGRIDRLGRSLDYSWRYTISPYLHYGTERDLYVVHMCVNGSGDDERHYYRCFADDRDRQPSPGPSRRAGS